MDKFYFISVVNNYNEYKNCVCNNTFIKENKNVKLVHFDNTKENIAIPIRYNDFLNNYDYSNPAWFIFCHQDWELKENITTVFKGLDKDNLYGAVGCLAKGCGSKYFRERFGNFQQNTKQGEKISRFVNFEGKAIEVETFDCMAIYVHSSLIKKYNLRFDERLSWDLYVEDFCINAKTKYNIKSYCLNMFSAHWSEGAGMSESYMKSLEIINAKYPNGVYGGTVSLIGKEVAEIKTHKDKVFLELKKRIIGAKNTSDLVK